VRVFIWEVPELWVSGCRASFDRAIYAVEQGFFLGQHRPVRREPQVFIRFLRQWLSFKSEIIQRKGNAAAFSAWRLARVRVCAYMHARVRPRSCFRVSHASATQGQQLPLPPKIAEFHPA
jgi:hypothetical protein